MDGIGDGFRLGVDEAVTAAATAHCASNAYCAARVGTEVGAGAQVVARADVGRAPAGACDGGSKSTPGEAGAASTGRDDCLAHAITTAYHAIGNAVPPPLGAALVLEIVRSASVRMSSVVC